MAFAAAVRLAAPPPAEAVERAVRRAAGGSGDAVVHVDDATCFVARCAQGAPISFDVCEDVAVVCDARLDNAAALRRQLGTDGPASPASLITAAYRRWGDQMPVKLRGDLAAVVVDRRSRTIHLVTDHVGSRPLYHVAGDGWLAASTELPTLIGDGFAPPTLDDIGLARFAAFAPVDDDRTCYAAVKRVPSATIVSIDPSGRRRRRYWELDSSSTQRFRSQRDCVEQFTSHLTRAVERRMDPAITATHLSGGLDSTAITALAATKSRRTGCDLVAYGLSSQPSPRHAHPTELPWIEAALSWLDDVEAHVLLDDRPLGLAGQRLAGRPVAHPCGPGEDRLRLLAAARGVGVVLSGWGGDDVVTAPVRRWDLVQGRRWSAVPGELHAGGLGAARELFQAMVSATPPGSVATGHELARTRRCDVRRSLLDLGVAPGFADLMLHVALDADEATAPPDAGIGARWSGRLHRGHLQERIEEWAEADAPHGLRTAYPMLDRDLLEFTATVPLGRLRHRGRPRALIRAVLQDLGDDRVHRRTDKTGPVSDLHDRWSAAVPAYERAAGDWSTSVTAPRYVEPRQLAAGLGRLTPGGSGPGSALVSGTLIPAGLQLLGVAAFVADVDRDHRAAGEPTSRPPFPTAPGAR